MHKVYIYIYMMHMHIVNIFNSRSLNKVNILLHERKCFVGIAYCVTLSAHYLVVMSLQLHQDILGVYLFFNLLVVLFYAV